MKDRCRGRRGLTALELNASDNAERFYLRHGNPVVTPATQLLRAMASMEAMRMARSLAEAP